MGWLPGTDLKTQAEWLYSFMARVFFSDSVGAGVYVFSDDHCPPHVHARHRGEGWVARIGFSYVNTVVVLLSIAPLRNIPLQRVVNQLLDDVEANLMICRRSWWQNRRVVCLVNQWARVLKPGKIEILETDMPSAKQITDAEYDPGSGRLRVVFRDGTAIAVEG